MSSRHVLVTGASGALGSVICEFLRSCGWTVRAWSQNDVDLRDAAEVEQAFAAITEPLHAVVHTVGGIVAGRALTDTTPSDFDSMIDLNLRTTYNVARHALPHLMLTRGALVTIGAQAAMSAAPMKAVYAASKAGVHALTLAVAEEGRQHGVRAVCFAPYIIDTPANQTWSTPEERSSWIHPLSIADEIERIISPSSDVTGIVFPMP